MREHDGGDKVGQSVEHESGVDATVATSRPPRAGPAVSETLNVPLMRALARVRSPPTTLGKAARTVGLKTVRAAHQEDQDVDGGEIPGEDQPQDENRPRKVAGYQDDPAVDAIREDSGQRARYGGQQTGDERASHGRGAARDLYYQDHERDHGDSIAHERGPLADPEPQKASSSRESRWWSPSPILGNETHRLAPVECTPGGGSHHLA